MILQIILIIDRDFVSTPKQGSSVSDSYRIASPAPLSPLLETRVSELDAGSALFLWAFRSCALGCSRKQCLTQVFDYHFGATGTEMLHHILVMAQILGCQGQRKIRLNLPRSDRLSQDEASLIRAIEAAQTGREAGLTAQLHWLAAGGPITTLARAACIVAGGFTAMNVRLPALKNLA